MGNPKLEARSGVFFHLQRLVCRPWTAHQETGGMRCW